MGLGKGTVEDMVITPDFWHGRRVFVTGHTGFKGGWLTEWLKLLGAEVCGYSKEPPSTPNLFTAANVAEGIKEIRADIRNGRCLAKAITSFAPSVVFHLAAQPIVRVGYECPEETYTSNIMGTLNFLMALRSTPSVRAAVSITSDKCYDNQEWLWPYRERDPLGGRDPYSASKACAELVTHSYARSFFTRDTDVRVSTGRAGNVIGGGDWGQDRLIPDLMRAFVAGDAAVIRNPAAVRPWQHVLDALSGYITLAERLVGEEGKAFEGAWNFGPDLSCEQPVGQLATLAAKIWGGGKLDMISQPSGPHEANTLKLDSTKARQLLGWTPAWGLNEAMQRTVGWYQRHAKGEDMRRVSRDELESYMRAANAKVDVGGH